MTAWHKHLLRGDGGGAERRAYALHREPFADVLRALEDLGRLPHAALLLGSGELAEAVAAWLAAHTRSVPSGGSTRTLPPARTEVPAILRTLP